MRYVFHTRGNPIGLLAAAIALLAGCTTLQNEAAAPGQDVVLIAPNIHFAVAGPGVFGSPADVEQMIVADYFGRKAAFETHVQIRPREIDMVALDPFGRRLATIRWQKASITYTGGADMPLAFRPEQIVANMEIVFAPDAAVSAALHDAGVSFVHSALRRAIRLNGTDAVVVDYENGEGWNRVVHLRNAGFGYRIDITSKQTGSPLDRNPIRSDISSR